MEDHASPLRRHDEEAPTLPISGSRQAISEQISRAREVAIMLENRLGPVLGPIRPIDAVAKLAAGPDEVSPMAADLADAAAGIREVVDQLMAMARRIEV